MDFSTFDKQRIVVTGACGSVGSELIRQLLTDSRYNPAEVIGIDNNESELFFKDQSWINDKRVRYFICDIRDKLELQQRFRGADVVFHTAALKHVVLCERSPEQAVHTNIQGVQNVIDASTACNVKVVIFTSSDKAVNPTNVMGTSKLMGERLMTAANSHKRDKYPIFASTRFGNVLGSNGSVVPIFKNQISSGGPLTLTHTDMTRFVMSIESASQLVLNTASLAKGGEVFITKMPIVRIEILAKAMIEVLSTRYGYSPEEIKIEDIGTKPGEKLYEELMSDEETRRSIELANYFSVLPAFRGIYQDIVYNYSDIVNEKVDNPYNSSTEISLEHADTVNFLIENNLIELEESENETRYWPGDKEEAASE